MGSKKIFGIYFRNAVFGIEDSLVSTVGLLSGVVIADVPRNTVVLTGIVLILVEAFSMAVGSFLSESAAESYIEQKDATAVFPVKAGIIMFFSYFVFGFVPLSPYFFWGAQYSFYISVFLSLLTLFILGGVSGKISKSGRLRSGLRMLLLGGGAIAVGITAGKIIGIPTL